MTRKSCYEFFNCNKSEVPSVNYENFRILLRLKWDFDHSERCKTCPVYKIVMDVEDRLREFALREIEVNLIS